MSIGPTIQFVRLLKKKKGSSSKQQGWGLTPFSLAMRPIEACWTSSHIEPSNKRNYKNKKRNSTSTKPTGNKRAKGKCVLVSITPYKSHNFCWRSSNKTAVCSKDGPTNTKTCSEGTSKPLKSSNCWASPKRSWGLDFDMYMDLSPFVQ